MSEREVRSEEEQNRRQILTSISRSSTFYPNGYVPKKNNIFCNGDAAYTSFWRGFSELVFLGLLNGKQKQPTN